MFKIHKGSTRTAVVLFNRLVLKFPRCTGSSFRDELARLKAAWKQRGFAAVWKDGHIAMLMRGMAEDLLMGVSANVCEGWLWLSTRASFLHPTCCLIICNLQRHAGDAIPTDEPRRRLFDSLSDTGRLYLGLINPHAIAPHNWRIVDGRLRLIDYGGAPHDQFSSLNFLISFQAEIEEGLSKPVA